MKNFRQIFTILLPLIFLVIFVDLKKLEIRTIDPTPVAEEDRGEVLKNSDFGAFERTFEGGVDDIIDLVNQARMAEGKSILTKNELLCQSAQAKAQDMKEKNYFEHQSPEGLQPWFFAEKVNYRYKTFGENLAEGFFSASDVHQGWMNSEGHRKNILSDDFEEIGVGIVEFEQNGLKSYLVVEHFGSQLKESDLAITIVCENSVKKSCSDANKKKDEINEAIDDQEKAIKDSKKSSLDKKQIKEMEANLDKLKDLKKELKKYLFDCENYIAKCQEWQ